MPSCAYCGGEFTARPVSSGGRPQKFCSARCRRDNFASNPANRVPCVVCGDPTGHTPGQSGRARCRACQRAEDRRRVEARWALIEEWWAVGLLLREIASRLGMSMDHIRAESARMREAGRDLPYRYSAVHRRHMKEGRARAV